MRRLFSLLLVVGLSACGAVSSPVVKQGPAAAGEVEIVTVTAGSLQAANASTYTPRTLPAVFSHSTGLRGSSGGAGAVPRPVDEPQVRPGPLPVRLPPAVSPAPYTIGIGDVLVLSVPSDQAGIEQLSGLLAAQNRRNGFTVQDDGTISIPDVGRVTVQGSTLAQAESALFQKLVSAGIEPTFSLEVAEFNAHRVTIGGEVRKPGVVLITLVPLTLAEAMGAAGGFAGQDRSVATIRLFRDGSLYEIPLSTYAGSAEVQQIRLKHGDAIHLDSAYDTERAQAYFAQQIASQTLRVNARTAALNQLETEIGLRRAELDEQRANFARKVEFDAVERDYVYIAGEVGAQSRFVMPFERKATLADALFAQAEGVPNATGNIGEVYVLRGTGDGRGIRAWHLDAYNAANLVLATRFELRPNDVVFVSEKPLTSLTRVLGQVAAVIGVAAL